MKKVLIGCGALLVLSVLLVLAFVIFLGVTGNQMKKRHYEIVRDLDLITSDEKIHYFYSDALFDIRKGLYFVTDQKLVLYNTTWPDPLLTTPYGEIKEIDADYSDSWIEDSYVYVLLKSARNGAFLFRAKRAWTTSLSSIANRS